MYFSSEIVVLLFSSSCPKKFLALSKDAENKGICTASKKYQETKLEELENNRTTISEEKYKKAKQLITEKSCLCVGLANASYLENNIKIKGQDQGVVICPGPNIAYFNQEVSLAKMIQHIYGKANVLGSEKRPNFFVKELKMYIDYLKNDIENIADEINASKTKKLESFKNNLLEGIEYYQKMFSNISNFQTIKNDVIHQFESYKNELKAIKIPN